MGLIELADLIVLYSNALGVRFTDIILFPPDKTLEQASGEPVGVTLESGLIKIYGSDSIRFPEENYPQLAQHEACHLKDLDEAVYTPLREVLAGPKYMVPSIEMYLAHNEYHASKRQIANFGQKNFDIFQSIGLEDFAKWMKQSARKGKENLLFAYFKEELKCNLMTDDPSLFPQVTQTICSPFAECFDKIKKSGLDWELRRKAIPFMAAYIIETLNIPASYDRGRIILNQKRNTRGLLSAMESGFFKNEEASEFSKTLVPIMNSAYGLSS